MKWIQFLAMGTGLGLTLIARAQNTNASAVGVNGAVVDEDNQPVAGAAVACFHGDKVRTNAQGEVNLPMRATTDAAGAFQLPELAFSSKSATLVVRKPGLGAGWRRFVPNQEPAPRVALGKPAVLAGTIVDESDKPAAGVEVCVVMALPEEGLDSRQHMDRLLTGKPARDCFSTRTGADGRFRLEGFPVGASAELAVEAPGLALRPPQRDFTSQGLTFRAGQEDIRLVIEPVGCVEGRVVFEGETAQPLPIARLTPQPEGPGIGRGASAPKPVESGPDGAFRLNNLASGSYSVQAAFGSSSVASGWVAESVSVLVESGRTNSGVELKAVRGGLLEVAVLGETNRKALAKMNVSAYKMGYQTQATPGTNGIALFRLPAGEYQIFAPRSVQGSGAVSATVETGKTNRIELAMSQPKQITGIVRGPEGNPTAGIAVRIVGMFGPGPAEQKTDAEGRFSLDYAPRQGNGVESVPCLLARDPDRNLAVAQDIETDTGPFDLKLAPGVTLVGRAESGGKPVTNCAVALIFYTGRSGMHLTGLQRLKGEGKFEIPALPPGRKYGLVVSAPGYGQKSIYNLDAPAEPGPFQLDPTDLKPASLKLVGQVLDGDDKPVAGASVSVHGDGQPSGNTRTDREGRFLFEKVCAGSVQLNAQRQDAFGNVAAEGGDTNVVIRLGASMSYSPDAAAHKLSGVVTDPEGKPVAGAQVNVFPHENGRWIKTGANGEFKLTWSMPSWRAQNGGSAVLVARELGRGLAALRELSEDATNQDLQLQPALILTGRVETPEAAPLAGAQVGVWLKTGNSYDQWDESLASTDAQGRYRVSGLPVDGNYMLYAQAKDRGKSQRNLDNSSETNAFELEPFVLKPADKLLAGQVLSQDEKPVSGVNVNLNGEGQPDGYMTTDSQGRFHFKVCEGSVRLFASSQNGYGQATAEAGETNVVIQIGNNSSSRPAQPARASLKDKPLPDLGPLGLAADALPAGKPVLLCLFDMDQRPSRRAARLLGEQHDALKQKGVTLLAVQAAVATSEALKSWQESNPVPFPVGRLAEKADATRWVFRVESLPWLILTDANRKVVAEGFALDDLETQLKAVTK